MNNDVNEDGFVLKQGVGDDGENNNVTVSLRSPATKAANTSTSSNTSENSEPLFGDSGNGGNVVDKNKGTNCISKLFDNKRKNMKRQLSASQRGQLLLNESKVDAQFKKNLATITEKSNEIFEKSVNEFSNVMQFVAQSMQLTTQAFVQNQFTLAQP